MTRVGFGWFVIGAGSRRMYTTRRLNGASRIESLSALPLRSLRLRGFLQAWYPSTQRRRERGGSAEKYFTGRIYSDL
jgi:hypothetical protein